MQRSRRRRVHANRDESECTVITPSTPPPRPSHAHEVVDAAGGGRVANTAEREGRLVGERFAHALAAKDGDGLLDLLADPIDFEGLSPGRHWRTDDPRELVEEVLLGSWFEPTDQIERLLEVRVGAVADRRHLSYRFAVRNADGDFFVEHQAYYEVEGPTISWMRLLGSGYRATALAPRRP